MRGRPCAAGFHQSWMSFSVTNSRIAFQIRFRHFRHNRNTKSDSGRWSYRPVNCICTKKYTVHRGSCRFSAGVEASVTWHTGFSQWRPLFVDSRRQIAQSQNRRRMCEKRLTKLSCAAQQEGIVHFYAVTDIKGLSCPLWWMREWRNLLTSTHVGYRSVIRRGVTIRLAKIRYISRYTTHDMVHDTIQNQLIYYQWKILQHCGMCHQYCYIKTVILARNSEFKINKDVHNHPCPKYLLLTNCVCKQNNKIS